MKKWLRAAHSDLGYTATPNVELFIALKDSLFCARHRVSPRKRELTPLGFLGDIDRIYHRIFLPHMVRTIFLQNSRCVYIRYWLI